MISAQSGKIFEYVDRNHRDTVVLVPGWATDRRIFGGLDLEFNYLIPAVLSPGNFEKDLKAALAENNISKISMLGWSLGGFLAAAFASKHKNLVNKLTLVSIRRRYKKEEIEKVRIQLTKNKKAYLYKFYSECFPDKKDMRRFRRGLFKHYCEELDLNHLLDVLDYLEGAHIDPESLADIKEIEIIHGEFDRIAPIKEAVDIGKNLPRAKFVCVKGTGHIPFLKENAGKYA